MALNLADRIAVRTNIVGRCTSAVVQFANYILGGGVVGGVNATDALAWARQAIRSPSAYGEQVSWHMLNAPEYIADGSGVADNWLQGSVEATVRNHFIVGA